MKTITVTLEDDEAKALNGFAMKWVEFGEAGRKMAKTEQMAPLPRAMLMIEAALNE